MNIINEVKINGRYFVKEYEEAYERGYRERYTEIVDMATRTNDGKYLMIMLTDRDITLKSVDEAYVDDVENFEVSDMQFKTITGHAISIIGNGVISIKDRHEIVHEPHLLKDVVKAIKKYIAMENLEQGKDMEAEL